MSFGLPAREMAHGQYWIHPALPELIEKTLLSLTLDGPHHLAGGREATVSHARVLASAEPTADELGDKARPGAVTGEWRPSLRHRRTTFRRSVSSRLALSPGSAGRARRGIRPIRQRPLHRHGHRVPAPCGGHLLRDHDDGRDAAADEGGEPAGGRGWNRPGRPSGSGPYLFGPGVLSIICMINTTGLNEVRCSSLHTRSPGEWWPSLARPELPVAASRRLLKAPGAAAAAPRAPVAPRAAP